MKKLWDNIDELLWKWDKWEDEDIIIKIGPHNIETNNFTIQYFCLLILIFIAIIF